MLTAPLHTTPNRHRDTDHPSDPTEPASVTELLHAAGRGEQHAWEEILRRYGRLVATVVRSFRLQEADARDAEQRTWLRLVENHQRVREPEHLGGWLSTTAGRECLHILRARRVVADLSDAETIPDAHADIEQLVLDAETAAWLWAAVDTLPPRRQRVVRALFCDDPAPYAEIARTTGLPVGSLGPTRARVLRQLRGLLENPGPTRCLGIRSRTLAVR